VPKFFELATAMEASTY